MGLDFSDLLIFAGLAAMIGGAWWIYPPAALILLGLALILLGLAAA